MAIDHEFSLAELNEIERHKYFLSQRCGRDVGFEHAKNDWLNHHAQQWNSQRQAKMLALQRDEIARYKWLESEKAKRDLGREAALEWIKKYAAKWRQWYESECEMH